MDELGAAEEAQQADVVPLDLRPVDPVRDAAHTKAEVPAIDDERDSRIDGHAAAGRRRVPIEVKRGRRRIGHNEAQRVGLELKVRTDVVEAETLQIVVVRGDIDAIAARTRPRLREERQACPIPSGNRQGKLVCLPSADARIGVRKITIDRALQDIHQLARELRMRTCREIRTRADVDPLKAPVVRAQHERLAPVLEHQTFCGGRRVKVDSAIGIEVGLELAADDVPEERPDGHVFASTEHVVKRAVRELYGAREVEVLAIREKHADVAQHPHQSHRDHDRSVPALPFDHFRRQVRGPSDTPERDASGVEGVVLGGRRRGGPHE